MPIDIRPLKAMGVSQMRRMKVFPSTGTDPLAVRLAEAARLSGFSDDELCERARNNEIDFLMNGDTILVPMKGLQRLIDSLPRSPLNTGAPVAKRRPDKAA
jgi:hypothetical protein